MRKWNRNPRRRRVVCCRVPVISCTGRRGRCLYAVVCGIPVHIERLRERRQGLRRVATIASALLARCADTGTLGGAAWALHNEIL